MDTRKFRVVAKAPVAGARVFRVEELVGQVWVAVDALKYEVFGSVDAARVAVIEMMAPWEVVAEL